MITLLIGENSFEIDQKIQQLKAEFDGTAEMIDGAELTVEQLPDIFMGMSLFSEKRLVIIRGVGVNKSIWDVFPAWLDRMNDDLHLVLVEPKPDKRTRTYKALQGVSSIHDYTLWTDRDERRAHQWVIEQASERGVGLSSSAARLLVERIGVDQWQLTNTLDKLSVYDEITEDIIRDSTEARPHESVFMLFETALRGDQVRVQEMIQVLSLSEDPYQLFGLLSGQAFQLTALAAAREGDDVAKDFGIHPFVLSKLRPYAAKRGVRGVSKVVIALAAADQAIKTSSLEPWLAIEQALLRIATNK